MHLQYEPPKLVRPVDGRDHRQGPENAPAVLVEYGDFQCPYCGQAYPIVKEIQHRLGDRLCFVFRHFPVTQAHPFAMQAAEASEAAAAQGKFWEMHDMLYMHQDELDIEGLKHYARALDLDTARFDRELESHGYRALVREGFLEGVRSGVNGTPAFYLNGTRYDGSWELDQLVAAIEDVLQEARQK